MEKPWLAIPVASPFFLWGQKMTASNKRNRKEKLWVKQNGLCCWCNEPMIHFARWRLNKTMLAKFGTPCRPKKMPPLLATLEHIHDQFDPARKTEAGRLNVALACWTCNNKRALESARKNLAEMDLARVNVIF